VTALEQKLFGMAGRSFNLNSPKECSAVMFDELRLKGKGKGKRTKSGYLSTSM
jgi:DNA polymerase-1